MVEPMIDKLVKGHADLDARLRMVEVFAASERTEMLDVICGLVQQYADGGVLEKDGKPYAFEYDSIGITALQKAFRVLAKAGRFTPTSVGSGRITGFLK